jgi:polyphosphate:AMP phosphotransferase
LKSAAQAKARERALERLRDELLDAQFELQESKSTAVAMIVAGAPAAGRTEVVNALLEWLDPKHISVHSFGEPDREDRQRPSMWRYWQTLPARGRMTIYFAGWYGDYFERSMHPAKAKRVAEREVERIRRFETLLVRERVRVLKVYLQVDARTQRGRIEQLLSDKLTRWRVSDEDRWLARHHTAVAKLARGCLSATHHPLSRWHRVDGTDESQRLIEIGRLLRDEFRAGSRIPGGASAAAKKVRVRSPQRLEAPDLEIAKEDYEREMAELQRRLALLVRRKRFHKHALVLAFEGMDAAGKGGAIRRVTQALDARQYQVVPVSAPSAEERQYPYLWRFWRHVPERGAVAIYDRSWYGRVLVERVRGFTPALDWQRAYEEIVDFERQLTEHGVAVAKFWLDVSKAEQLRRFRARNEDPLKRFKVDQEDWKNRRYYDDYQVAAGEMIARTDIEDARWTVVAADDKKHARLCVLRTVCETLERTLE